MTRKLYTVKEAAEILGVSVRHIRDMIHEADTFKGSTWKFGRELINMSEKTALRRTIRINVDAVINPQKG